MWDGSKGKTAAKGIGFVEIDPSGVGLTEEFPDHLRSESRSSL